MDAGAWPWALLPWPGSLDITSGPLKDPTTAPSSGPPLTLGQPCSCWTSEQGHCGFLCLPPGHCVRSRPSVERKTATVRLAASGSPFHWLEHHTLMEITYSSSWNGQPAYGKMLFSLLSHKPQLITLSAHGFVLLPKYSQLPVISHSSAFIFLTLPIISFASGTLSSSSIKRYSKIA